MSTAERVSYKFMKLEEKVDDLVRKQTIQIALMVIAFIYILPHTREWFGRGSVGNIIYGCFIMFVVGVVLFIAANLIALAVQLAVTIIAAPFEAVYNHEVRKRKKEEAKRAAEEAEERKRELKRRAELKAIEKAKQEKEKQKAVQKMPAEKEEKREEKRKEEANMEDTVNDAVFKNLKIMDPIDLACKKGSENTKSVESLYQVYWLDDIFATPTSRTQMSQHHE